jgi:hypothetical protein
LDKNAALNDFLHGSKLGRGQLCDEFIEAYQENNIAPIVLGTNLTVKSATLAIEDFSLIRKATLQ